MDATKDSEAEDKKHAHFVSIRNGEVAGVFTTGMHGKDPGEIRYVISRKFRGQNVLNPSLHILKRYSRDPQHNIESLTGIDKFEADIQPHNYGSRIGIIRAGGKDTHEYSHIPLPSKHLNSWKNQDYQEIYLRYTLEVPKELEPMAVEYAHDLFELYELSSQTKNVKNDTVA
jgi:hypothetical protein